MFAVYIPTFILKFIIYIYAECPVVWFIFVPLTLIATPIRISYFPCSISLAVFPIAAWYEVSNRSTFESKGLCHLLLVTHFENADAVYHKMAHEFDVFTENIVQLTIFSKVNPILSEKTLQDLLPTLQFTLHNFEQDLLSNLM